MTAPAVSPLGAAWAEARAKAGAAEWTRDGIHAPKAPAEPEPWLRALFPKHVRYPFAARHHDFWEWVWSIEKDSSPRPFVGIWPRESGKSTSAELAAAALGARGKRFYAIYVRMTQDKADDSVSNIAALLEAETVATHYPRHSERKLNKFGAAKGWRRNRLSTEGGFTVDALGLDAAARGAKIEHQRPDLIILDDIDDKLDSPATTAKKRALITTSILPAGSENVAVLAIQNLIIGHGIFTQLADGRADFLTDRIMSGPHAAILDLETEWQHDPETGTRQAMIVSGTPTWVGQGLAKCQAFINRWGLSSFLKECQHQVTDRAEGIVLRFNRTDHTVPLSDDECRELVRLGRVFGGIDFGAWRFAFTLWAVDRSGVPYCIAEHFSQRQGLAMRAQAIHELCERYDVFNIPLPAGPRSYMVPIWGDAANPQDIMELNIAFHKGWNDAKGRKVTSPLRVVPVLMENKARKTSVERLNNLLDQHAIQFRQELGEGDDWQLGMNAASPGTQMQGSRLLWEIEQWSYAIPKEGEAQEQDADDNTADGADAVASMRYAIMSWWSPANPAKDRPIPEDRNSGVDFGNGKPRNPRGELHRDRMMERFAREQAAAREAQRGQRSVRRRATQTVPL